MVDWNTGVGNARFWTLKMLINSFGRNTKHIYSTISSNADVFASAMICDTYVPPTPPGMHNHLPC